MKRFLMTMMVMTLAFVGTAFGAEKQVKFLRDGEEIVLENEAICKDGKWMVSLSDLERMTESGWERVPEAEPKEIDDIGFTMNATRSEAGEDGITNMERRVFADLPAGQYRMGVPFYYRYYVQNIHGNPWDKYFENGEEEKLGWDFYYSTHWGEPDFYFEGAGLSTYNAEKDTYYMLYGEFMVE